MRKQHMLSRLFVSLFLLSLSMSTYAADLAATSKCPDYQQAVSASKGLKAYSSFSLGEDQWIMLSGDLPPNGSWKKVAFLSNKSDGTGSITCYASDNIYGPAIEGPAIHGYPCTVNGEQLRDNTVTKCGANTGWTFYPPDSIMSCKE